MKSTVSPNNHTSLKVAELLVEAGAIQIDVLGQLPFRGGGKGPIYVNCRVLQSEIAALKVLAHVASTTWLRKLGLARLAGVAEGAIPFSLATALVLHIGHNTVRESDPERPYKPHIDGKDVEGQRVGLCKDVWTREDSSVHALQQLLRAGATVNAFLTIFTYAPREMAVRVSAVATGLESHSLTNLECVLLALQKAGKITPNGVSVVERWHQQKFPAEYGEYDRAAVLGAGTTHA